MPVITITIEGPPKSGKTAVAQFISAALSNAHAQVQLKSDPLMRRSTEELAGIVRGCSVVVQDQEGSSSRVDELLKENNRYQEEARYALRVLHEERIVNAALKAQLATLKDALEFYADEGVWLDKGGDADAGLKRHELPPIIEDSGATAEAALQEVFGPGERPQEPKS